MVPPGAESTGLASLCLWQAATQGHASNRVQLQSRPPTASLLAAIMELGLEFDRLGWTERLPGLREFYRVVRSGGTCTEAWSAEHLERLRQMMGLGPNPLPVATHCPRCPPAPAGGWNGTRTVVHLPDRWVSACVDCGGEWVTLERATVTVHDRNSLSASD